MLWVIEILRVTGPLLIQLIEFLIVQHKKNHPGMSFQGTDSSFASHKSAFLAQVSRHPMLHPRKMEIAAALFDKVATAHDADAGSHKLSAVIGKDYAHKLVDAASGKVEQQYAGQAE